MDGFPDIRASFTNRHLVSSKIIDIMVQRLSDFKFYDNVLVDAYSFLGATFNFELVNYLLLAIRVRTLAELAHLP